MDFLNISIGDAGLDVFGYKWSGNRLVILSGQDSSFPSTYSLSLSVCVSVCVSICVSVRVFHYEAILDLNLFYYYFYY